jgi:predicted deacylase
LLLSHDADLVLDLHCDCEGVLHFYTEEACWNAAGAPGAPFPAKPDHLLAKNSGQSRLTNACPVPGGSWPMPVWLQGLQVPAATGLLQHHH